MNILIVDDDVLIRNWLSMLLKQVDTHPLELREASDGLEALEVCRAHPIDLVITDIKMPRLDGIELINTLRTELPSIRTAVLSSYDDFGYVRIAMKSGALDYILKAEMKLEDITDLLEKVTVDIEFEKSLFSSLPKSNASDGAKQLFSQYISGESASCDSFLAYLSPPLSMEHLCLSMIQLESSSHSELPHYMIAAICEDNLKASKFHGLSFSWGKMFHVLIYQARASVPEEQTQEYQRLMSTLDKALEKYMSVTIAQSVNLICHQTDDLRAQFQKAQDILDFRQYYQFPMPQQKAQEKLETTKALKADLHKALANKAYAQAVEILKAYVQSAEGQQMIPRLIRYLAGSGINLLLASAPIEQHSGSWQALSGCLTELSGTLSKEALRQVILRFERLYLDGIDQSEQQLSPAIHKVITYIHQNYANKITLDEAASQVFLSRSYLSQLFKKEVGLAFGDYVEEVRLSQAKRLIRASNKPMHEISEQVGFSSQNYFTKVFKKATGVSPLRYKRQ